MTCWFGRPVPLVLLAALFLASPKQVQAETIYYVPPTQFNAAIEVMDMGYANIFGLFREATGSFAFDEPSKTVSHIRLAINAASLLASNGENQRALTMLLGSDLYPEITLIAGDTTSFADGKAEIKADLTLHGVTKPMTLTATLNRVSKSTYTSHGWSQPGDILGLSLHGSVKCADFGLINANGEQSRFSDSLTLMLETQATRR